MGNDGGAGRRVRCSDCASCGDTLALGRRTQCVGERSFGSEITGRVATDGMKGGRFRWPPRPTHRVRSAHHGVFKPQ
jgi:hypothetical protein